MSTRNMFPICITTSNNQIVERGKYNKLLRKAFLKDKKMQRKLYKKIKDGIKILPNFKIEIDKLRL